MKNAGLSSAIVSTGCHCEAKAEESCFSMQETIDFSPAPQVQAEWQWGFSTPSAFDEVVDIALTGAFGGLSVCVMCLTEEILERWRSRLEDLSHPVTLLDVLNTNRATLEDWQ